MLHTSILVKDAKQGKIHKTERDRCHQGRRLERVRENCLMYMVSFWVECSTFHRIVTWFFFFKFKIAFIYLRDRKRESCPSPESQEPGGLCGWQEASSLSQRPCPQEEDAGPEVRAGNPEQALRCRSVSQQPDTCLSTALNIEGCKFYFNFFLFKEKE